MCKLGGIVLLRTKQGWEVQEWKNGKAPAHDHFSWDMHKWAVDPNKRITIYPNLKDFRVGEGLLIGARSDYMSILPMYLLDGIVILEERRKNDKN